MNKTLIITSVLMSVALTGCGRESQLMRGCRSGLYPTMCVAEYQRDCGYELNFSNSGDYTYSVGNVTDTGIVAKALYFEQTGRNIEEVIKDNARSTK